METKLVLAEINPQAPKGERVKVIDQKTVKIELPKKPSEAIQGPSKPQVKAPQTLDTKEPKHPWPPTIVHGIWDSMPLGLKLATGTLGAYGIYRMFSKKKKSNETA